MRNQAVALGVLQGLDLVTTWNGLKVAHEQNPVGVALLGGGFGSLIAAKIAGTFLILYLAWELYRRGSESMAQGALAWCCSLMLGVVAWNIWVGWLHF